MPGMKRSFFGRARALGIDNDGESGVSEGVSQVTSADDHFEADLDADFDIDSFGFSSSTTTRKPPRPSLKRRPASTIARRTNTSKHTVSTKTPFSTPRLNPPLSSASTFPSRAPRTPRPTLYSTTQTKLAYQSTMASLTPEMCFEKLERHAVALRRTSSLSDVVGLARGGESTEGLTVGSVSMKQRSVSLGGPVEGKKRRLGLRPIDLNTQSTELHLPSPSGSRRDAEDGLTSLRSSSPSAKDVLVQASNYHSPSLGASASPEISYPMDSPNACSAPSLSSSTSTITSIFASTMDSAPSPVSSELSGPPCSPRSPPSLVSATPDYKTMSPLDPADGPALCTSELSDITNSTPARVAQPEPNTESVNKQLAKAIKPVRHLTRPCPAPISRRADSQTTVPPRSLSRSASGSSRRYTEIYDIDDQGIIDLTGIDD